MTIDERGVFTIPYGYFFNKIDKLYVIVPDEAKIIKKIFQLYIDGWGYKKIAHYLTDSGIPIPRMKETEQIEERDETYNRKFIHAWSIVTVQGILDNDFYIGTLRQHKFKRNIINGPDVRVDEKDVLVFENNHEPIIDIRTWMKAKKLRELRSTTHYRGVKNYPNVYTGLLFCGDCGKPMFFRIRADILPSYICSGYHKHGRKVCSSHTIKLEKLNEILENYFLMIIENHVDIFEKVRRILEEDNFQVKELDTTLSYVESLLDGKKRELKSLIKDKQKDIIRVKDFGNLGDIIPILEVTYQEIEDDILLDISDLEKKFFDVLHKKNDIIFKIRFVMMVMDIFNDIIEKNTIENTDVILLINNILVYDDHIVINLVDDVKNLLLHGSIIEIRDDITG